MFELDKSTFVVVLGSDYWDVYEFYGSVGFEDFCYIIGGELEGEMIDKACFLCLVGFGWFFPPLNRLPWEFKVSLSRGSLFLSHLSVSISKDQD